MIREMFLYPWDVWEEGQEKVADELAQMRIRSVSVAALYHQARLLLPHNPLNKLKIHPGGSLHVPFRENAYSRLKPRRGADIQPERWQGMIDALKSRGIAVTAWAVLLHNSFLASAFPQFSIVNVYGDHLPSNLCPSSPEVQAYLEQIVKDIAATGVEQIDIESLDYAGFLHGDHHEMQAYLDTVSLNRLLGLCFCPSCMENARRHGIDAEGLKRQLHSAADAFLEMKPVEIASVPALREYDAMRCDRITELYQVIRTAAGIPVRPILWAANGAEPVLSGVDTKRMGMEEVSACYPDDPEQVSAFVKRIRSMTGDAVRITGGIRLLAPHTVRTEQVVIWEQMYREAHVDRVIYYQYGMAPQPYLDALKAKEDTI